MRKANVRMASFDQSQPHAQAQTRPVQQIDRLVCEHYAYIHRLALSILDDPAEADDAAQETFIAAHRALSSFRGQSSPRTWLTSIAVNTCRGRLRRRKVRQAMQSTLEALHLLAERPHVAEQAVMQNETDRELWQAVDELLDEKHRLPVILRYVHDLSVPEIAMALGISQGTVHSRLHYARQKLANALEGGQSCK
jgi:RNA polymerase sigma-70 factor, ECF subfamily